MEVMQQRIGPDDVNWINLIHNNLAGSRSHSNDPSNYAQFLVSILNISSPLTLVSS